MIVQNMIMTKILNFHLLHYTHSNTNRFIKTNARFVKKLTIHKINVVKQKRLCFVCLEKGHSAGTCKSKHACNKCSGKHNIATCTFSKDKADIPKNENAENNAQNLTITNNICNNKNNFLLQTATMSISGVDNKKQFYNVQFNVQPKKLY